VTNAWLAARACRAAFACCEAVMHRRSRKARLLDPTLDATPAGRGALRAGASLPACGPMRRTRRLRGCSGPTGPPAASSRRTSTACTRRPAPRTCSRSTAPRTSARPARCAQRAWPPNSAERGALRVQRQARVAGASAARPGVPVMSVRRVVVRSNHSVDALGLPGRDAPAHDMHPGRWEPRRPLGGGCLGFCLGLHR